MRILGIEAHYPQPNLSRPHPDHKIYPYLLRGVAIERPNQVWSTDITYIPMQGGFLYLVAVMVRSIIRHGPLRSSDLAHLGAFLLSAIQPGGFLAAPAGAEPGDARRAAPFRRSGRRGGQKQRAPAARITSSSSSPASAENGTTRYPSR